MRVQSAILTDMSGKLGGLVAAKARGGIQYLRALVVPRNPSSFLQLAVRQAISSASAYWRTVMTEANQELWWDIAEGSQTGQSLFVRVNQPRFYVGNTDRGIDDAGDPYTDAIPTIVTPPDGLSTDQSTPTVTIDDSDNLMEVDATATGTWSTETVAAGKASLMLVYASHQQNASRFSRQHPYALVAAIVRAPATSPPSLPTPIDLSTMGYGTIAGRVMYVKTVVQDQLGRVSVPIEQRITIGA